MAGEQPLCKLPCEVLGIGDVHGKPWIVEEVARLVDQYDYVVFLGDYVDDWRDYDRSLSLAALRSVLELQDSYPHKVLPCCGNHDIEYVDAKHTSTAHSRKHHDQIAALVWPNLYRLPIARQIGRVIFSHAGFTADWWRSNIGGGAKVEFDADQLQERFIKSINCAGDRTFAAELIEDPFDRGGYHWRYVGPLWERHINISPLSDYDQVVGHTPVYKIQEYGSYRVGGGRVLMCDTFSTDDKGYKLGDQTALHLTIGESGFYSDFAAVPIRPSRS
jgi:hypothetical protein